MTVWLAPGTVENIATSIDKAVSWDFIERHLQEPDIEAIKRGGDGSGAFCWAMTQGSRAHFDSMKTYDEILITPRGTGLFTRYAEVYHKSTNVGFGRALWPSAGANPWQHLFFLRNVQKVNLSKSEVLRDAGYENPKDALSGIRPVVGERLTSFLNGSKTLRRRLGLPEPLDLEAKKPTADPVILENRVVALQKRGAFPMPTGVVTPAVVTVNERKERQRDPAVKAWVKINAGGRCELCRNPAPFKDDAGMPYLEVHHMRTLAEGGSDTAQNAVAVCPTCHRLLHYSSDREVAKARIYRIVERLIEE